MKSLIEYSAASNKNLTCSLLSVWWRFFFHYLWKQSHWCFSLVKESFCSSRPRISISKLRFGLSRNESNLLCLQIRAVELFQHQGHQRMIFQLIYTSASSPLVWNWMCWPCWQSHPSGWQDHLTSSGGIVILCRRSCTMDSFTSLCLSWAARVQQSGNSWRQVFPSTTSRNSHKYHGAI